MGHSRLQNVVQCRGDASTAGKRQLRLPRPARYVAAARSSVGGVEPEGVEGAPLSFGLDFGN